MLATAVVSVISKMICCGLDAVGGQLALDQRQQLGVAGRGAGDVDLEDEAVLAGELLAEHLDRLAHDPAGRSRRSGRSARRRAGRRPARSARPSGRACAGASRTGGSRPCASYMIGCACSTRRSSSSASRITSVQDRREARREPASLRAAVGGDPVAAALLGLVHREVGVDEHVLAGQAVGVERGDADAGADRAQAAGGAGDADRADRGQHAVGELLGLRRGAVGEQDRELVAAQAGDRGAVATCSRSASATLQISWSPALWPSVSLTFLKRSMSSSTAAPRGP